jgi:tripartite-type tricarboxylate transporter receptor subunit TctC
MKNLPSARDQFREVDTVQGYWRGLGLALALALALAAGLVAAPARADDYPSRSIRLIVPYAAGGGADSVARIIAKRVSETIGQPIVIENRGGGGSIIGTELVNTSEPDGYTLLLGQSGPISINPAIYKTLPYDPVKDFAPVAMTTSYPYIMVVNPALGVKTLQQFVTLAKGQPGRLNYGSTGVGAANHMVTELFDRRAGIEMTHIPYRGTALAVTDLIAGQVQMVFADPISALPYINAAPCWRWR